MSNERNVGRNKRARLTYCNRFHATKFSISFGVFFIFKYSDRRIRDEMRIKKNAVVDDGGQRSRSNENENERQRNRGTRAPNGQCQQQRVPLKCFLKRERYHIRTEKKTLMLKWEIGKMSTLDTDLICWSAAFFQFYSFLHFFLLCRCCWRWWWKTRRFSFFSFLFLFEYIDAKNAYFS